MSGTNTFSESWYRIAGRHVALRPHIEVQRQIYRGERYFVLHDPFNNQFFRLRPAAYAFIARLSFERTVDEVWRECLEVDPEGAPGQEQALRLLTQLHASHLIQSDLPPDSARIFERHQTRQQKERRSMMANILFAKFPVFDPDQWLKKLRPLLALILSPAGALVWLGTIGVAIKLLADHAGEFSQQSEGVLAPGNLPLLYAVLVGLKAIHELGHAAACRRLGGEVHTVGIMLMILTPVPYVDTTSSWSFRSKWQRAFVGAAGMVSELFAAALAVFVWANTAPGVVLSLAYNAIFVASVSTLLFNINPLLRFDGYYILSDLLELPNLQQRSAQQVQYVVQRWLFGNKESQGVAARRREAAWLFVYGVASQAYRVLLSASILLFVFNRFLILGVLMASFGLVSWLLVPLFKFLRYLLFDPHLGKHRVRAFAVSFGVLALLLVILQLVPVPHHFSAPGVLETEENSRISVQAAGRVAEVLVKHGQRVAAGQPLLRMENPMLALEIASAHGELKEAQASWQRALEEAIADLEPIESRIASVIKLLQRLEHEQAALTARAPHAGIWVAPEMQEFRLAWLSRGTEIGRVVNPREFYFSAVISQEEASRLFVGEIRAARVRLRGQAEHSLGVSQQKIIPTEQRNLPSAALGWKGGGDVAVAAGESGLQAVEPFFELRASLAPQSGVELLPGRSGLIRFDLPAEPLLPQWTRKLRQLLQRRGIT